MIVFSITIFFVLNVQILLSLKQEISNTQTRRLFNQTDYKSEVKKDTWLSPIRETKSENHGAFKGLTLVMKGMSIYGCLILGRRSHSSNSDLAKGSMEQPSPAAQRQAGHVPGRNLGPTEWLVRLRQDTPAWSSAFGGREWGPSPGVFAKADRFLRCPPEGASLCVTFLTCSPSTALTLATRPHLSSGATWEMTAR